MKRIFAMLTTICALSAFSQEASADFFPASDAFFKAWVDIYGNVNYAGIKAAPDRLNELVTKIGVYDYRASTGNTRKAFLINAYNILMIKSIVDNYPVAKPTDIEGVFDRRTHNVGGQQITLSDIENKMLRVEFPDARIHFALVCGAVSCPQLMNSAYMPTTLDQQLQSRTIKTLNDRNFIRLNVLTSTVEFSQIFEWYKDDFLKESKNYIEFVNKYRTTKVPALYKETTYPYDWSLNQKRN